MREEPRDRKWPHEMQHKLDENCVFVSRPSEYQLLEWTRLGKLCEARKSGETSDSRHNAGSLHIRLGPRGCC
jgi:hypothetical protein